MNPRNPIMAAVLAASLGLCAPGTSYAVDTPAPTQPTCPVPATETNPLNVLTGLIACETDAAGPIKRDIGNRLVAFVLSTDAQGAPLFVTPELLATIPAEKRDTPAHIAAVVPPATGTDEVAAYYQTIRDWVKRAQPAEVAELYLVMGDAAPPTWVTGHPVLSRVVRPATTNASDCRQGLVPGLLGAQPTTAGAAPRRATRAWRNGIAVSNKVADTGLFLFAAASNAHSLLADARTCAQLRTSITNNEDRPVVPVGPGRGSSQLAADGFSYQDLFLDGGVGGNITGPRDTVQAPYYVKLETQRDPATNAVRTYVTVFDASETPGYIRRVPINPPGTTNIQHAPGRWNLVVDIRGTETGDVSIAVHRPGDDDAATGIRTTGSELAQARFDQAVRKGQVLNVGGQSYYTLGQANGTGGSHLLFPTRLAGVQAGRWDQLQPDFVVNTYTKNADGLYVPGTGRPDIGTVNGRPYHLEMENGKFVVKDGPGDQPPPASTTGATPPGASTTDRGAAAANQGDGNWQDDAEANAGLDADTRTRYRIQRHTAADGQLEYNVITPAGFIRDNARSYRGVTNMRGLGHYLVYEAGNGVAYQDLLVAVQQNGSDGQPRPDFATVMQVANKGAENAEFFAVAGAGGATDLRWIPSNDVVVLQDGLKRYLNYTDQQVATAVANLRTHVGANRYIINNARRGRIVATAQPNNRKVIFPEIANDANAPADNPGTQPGQSGQLLEQPLTWSAGDEPLRGSITVGQGASSNVTANRVLPAGTADTQEAAALYQVSGSPASPSDPTWYLIFKFREQRPTETNANATNIAKTSPIPMFQGHNAPAASAIGIKGYPTFPDTGVTLNSGARIVKVDGTGAAKGAWVFLKSAGAPTETNCVGPVIWWGVSEAQARTAGCNGRPLP